MQKLTENMWTCDATMSRKKKKKMKTYSFSSNKSISFISIELRRGRVNFSSGKHSPLYPPSPQGPTMSLGCYFWGTEFGKRRFLTQDGYSFS